MDTTQSLQVWVIDAAVDAGTLERLGDARRVADRIGAGVAVLLVGPGFEDPDTLIAHGADHVCCAITPASTGPATRVAEAKRIVAPHRPRLVFASGDARGREWAARLALECGWCLVSPALMTAVRGDDFEITGLDHTGGMARRVRIGREAAAVVTLRPGVGEAITPDPARRGDVVKLPAEARPEPVEVERTIPADAATVDIRFADRLVAGGRGLGSKQGFDALRRFAGKIGASVAASRMAVDLGWIEHARQVGQTGKTVAPDLYLACGISGASHHLEGMAAAKHVVAINTDAQAPIFKAAHLALVADLYEVLQHAEEGMKP